MVGTDDFALAVGLTLIVWIVVQVAVIRGFSLFQPAYLAVGAYFVAASARLRAAQSCCWGGWLQEQVEKVQDGITGCFIEASRPTSVGSADDWQRPVVVGFLDDSLR